MYLQTFIVLGAIFTSGNSFDYMRHAREAVTPNRFERVQCWAQMKQLNKYMKQATCKPRDTMVEVISDAANIMIFPNKVAVKRCDGGSCYGKSSCLPTKTKEVKIPVRKHDFRTGREICGVVYVEEHVTCKCGCSVMAHHCSPRQEYKHRECACQCINLEEEEQCLIEDKIWDPRSCSCMCKEIDPECSTGTEWVPSMCKCKRIVMDETNSVLNTHYQNFY